MKGSSGERVERAELNQANVSVNNSSSTSVYRRVVLMRGLLGRRTGEHPVARWVTSRRSEYLTLSENSRTSL